MNLKYESHYQPRQLHQLGPIGEDNEQLSALDNDVNNFSELWQVWVNNFYTNITATGVIAGVNYLSNYIFSANLSVAGSIKIYDGTDATGTLIATHYLGVGVTNFFAAPNITELTGNIYVLFAGTGSFSFTANSH